MSRSTSGGLLSALAAAMLAFSGCGEDAPDTGCPTASQRMTLDVAGDCGAAGQVVAHVASGSCRFTVDGAEAVGLPTVGWFEARPPTLASGNWRLYGEAGTGWRRCTGVRQGLAVVLDCIDIDGNPACTASLTPGKMN